MKKNRFPTRMRFVKVSLAAADRVRRSHVSDGCTHVHVSPWVHVCRAVSQAVGPTLQTLHHVKA